VAQADPPFIDVPPEPRDPPRYRAAGEQIGQRPPLCRDLPREALSQRRPSGKPILVSLLKMTSYRAAKSWL
jgi:hypothetical protein